MRFEAMHICPLFIKADQNNFGMDFSTLASLRTMAGSLPPSSEVILFTLTEALRMIARPVAVEPVKDTLSIPECSVIQGPRRSPPLMMLNTPGGSRFRVSSPSFSDVRGVNGE